MPLIPPAFTLLRDRHITGILLRKYREKTLTILFNNTIIPAPEVFSDR